MGHERSSHRRAPVLALVGMAVIGGPSVAFAHWGAVPTTPPSIEPAPSAPPSDAPPAAPETPGGNQAPQALPQPSPYNGYPPGGGYPPPPPGYPPPRYYPPFNPYQGNGYGPPPPYPPYGYVRVPPPNVHDGLYLRLHLGFGYTNLKRTGSEGEEMRISGSSVSLGVAIGGTIAPNLIVFGSFIATLAEQPDVTGVGESAATSSGSAGIFGLGVGMAYYVQPMNIYLSGTIAGTQVDLSDANGDSVYDSKFGIGFQGLVGKEWWVSSEWGLGIAAEVILAGSMKDKTDSSVSWTASAFNVLFSATCN